MVSQRHDFKVVVISDVTSTRGVVANILRKIRLKGEATHDYNLVAHLDSDGDNHTTGIVPLQSDYRYSVPV